MYIIALFISIILCIFTITVPYPVSVDDSHPPPPIPFDRNRLDLMDMKGWENAYGHKREEMKDNQHDIHNRIEEQNGNVADNEVHDRSKTANSNVQSMNEKIEKDEMVVGQSKMVSDSKDIEKPVEDKHMPKPPDAPAKDLDKASKISVDFTEETKGKDEGIMKWNINMKKMVDNPLVALKTEKIIITDKKTPQDNEKKMIKETIENEIKNDVQADDAEAPDKDTTQEDSEEDQVQHGNDDKNKTKDDDNLGEDSPKLKESTLSEEHEHTLKNKQMDSSEDPLTPVPYNGNVPKPTSSLPMKTTPMTVTTRVANTILQMDEEHRPIEGKHMMPIYLPKDHLERLAEMAKEDQTIEVKFIDDPNYIDEKLQLDTRKDNVVPKTTVSKIDPITTDQIMPTVPLDTTTTKATITIKDTVMSFLSKVAAALKCTKRDCSDAIKSVNVTKRKELKEHSTPPRRVRQVTKESGTVCTCQL